MQIREWIVERRAELAKFAVVGGVAFVVDLGLFNLLLYGLQTTLSEDEKVLTSRTISALAATLVAWIGNRLWAFSHRKRVQRAGELSAFLAVNVVAFAISLGTVAFSTYVLGLKSPLMTNAFLIVGIGLGTIARYAGYRRYVFTGGHVDAV
jgi:putative flippase GtrA